MRFPTQRLMASISSTLKGKYPAKAHAKRVAEHLQKAHSNVTGVIYLEGQKTRMIEDNDGEQPFR
jgi:Xaa-Pro dipeptidase